jgi:hypothetical protein
VANGEQKATIAEPGRMVGMVKDELRRLTAKKVANSAALRSVVPQRRRSVRSNGKTTHRDAARLESNSTDLRGHTAGLLKGLPPQSVRPRTRHATMSERMSSKREKPEWCTDSL